MKSDSLVRGSAILTWFKVTSLNTKSPARSRALRVVSTYAEECGTTPYDLFRALSHHEISAFTAYPASHTGKQTADSSLFLALASPKRVFTGAGPSLPLPAMTHRQGSSQSAGGLEHGAVRRAAAGQRA